MTVITVSQVNTYIKALLEESAPLKNVYIVGEISNFIHYTRSGHMYFSLKDERSQIKAVMFASFAERLRFQLRDGMKVVCRGRVSLYERDGSYQLYVEDVQPDGLGALSIAYEQLKAKLEAEGLFDKSDKKALPQYPIKIGVVTSDMGAAVEDIKNITNRRYPIAELVIAPTLVQGENAPPDIVKSIKLLDNMDDIDVIIIGRGGGSLEDLWAFNTEEVARAVYSCNTPVISAIGHETDFTICDFVSDLRAPTPSAAAELVVPDINNILAFLENADKAMLQLLNYKIEQEYQRLDYMISDSALVDIESYFEQKKLEVKSLDNALNNAIMSKIENNSRRTLSAIEKLNILSPLATIARGFGIVKKGTSVVTDVNCLNSGDNVEIDLKNGQVICTVNEVINNE